MGEVACEIYISGIHQFCCEKGLIQAWNKQWNLKKISCLKSGFKFKNIVAYKWNLSSLNPHKDDTSQQKIITNFNWDQWMKNYDYV